MLNVGKTVGSRRQSIHPPIIRVGQYPFLLHCSKFGNWQRNEMIYSFPGWNYCPSQVCVGIPDSVHPTYLVIFHSFHLSCIWPCSACSTACWKTIWHDFDSLSCHSGPGWLVTQHQEEILQYFKEFLLMSLKQAPIHIWCYQMPSFQFSLKVPISTCCYIWALQLNFQQFSVIASHIICLAVLISKSSQCWSALFCELWRQNLESQLQQQLLNDKRAWRVSSTVLWQKLGVLDTVSRLLYKRLGIFSTSSCDC